ncbi:hypothetical protein D3C75_595200 [compost metagenome]
MRSAGIVDQRHLWLGQSNGVGNLANARGTQLDDRRGVFRGNFEQRQRGAEVVVQVATRGQDRTAGAQDAGEHFLDRGLAAGAGDRYQPTAKRSAVERAELAKGQTGIGHHQLRQLDRLHLVFHQRGGGTLAGHLLEIVVTVETLTTEGDEQLPRLDRAAVDADAVEEGIGPGQFSLQGSQHTAQHPGFKHPAPRERPAQRRPVRYLRRGDAPRRFPGSPRGPCRPAGSHRRPWPPQSAGQSPRRDRGRR